MLSSCRCYHHPVKILHCSYFHHVLITGGASRFEVNSKHLKIISLKMPALQEGSCWSCFWHFTWGNMFVEEAKYLRENWKNVVLVMDGNTFHNNYNVSPFGDNNEVLAGFPSHTPQNLHFLHVSISGSWKQSSARDIYTCTSSQTSKERQGKSLPYVALSAICNIRSLRHCTSYLVPS